MVVCVDLDPAAYTNDADTGEELNIALQGQEERRQRAAINHAHPIHPSNNSRVIEVHRSFFVETIETQERQERYLDVT